MSGDRMPANMESALQDSMSWRLASQACRDGFREGQRGCQLGDEETLDRWLAYHDGWQRAFDRLRDALLPGGGLR